MSVLDFDNKGEKRSCGSCYMCCTLMGVPEIDKKDGEPCKYAKKGPCKDACTIYETRPQACRDFECLWLLGFGEERDKPDKSKVIFVTGRSPVVGDYLTVRAYRSGAYETKRMEVIINAISATMLVLLIDERGNRKFCGPDDKMRMVMGILEEHQTEEEEDLARQQVEDELFRAGIIEDPDIDGGLLG